MRDPALEAAIVRGEPAAYAVYADWLQSHGQVHGELIAMQLALRAQTSTEQFLRFTELEAKLRA
ncbi:MAG TPA: TIGR02996 domain-containing protein, partial [Kofleriaceae bacterium]